MKLLNLHTDILLHLLNRKFTLHQLFHLRVLCQQLCTLIESPNCIGSRRTLKLFWSFRDIKRYTLDLYQLGLEAVHELRLRNIGNRNDDLVLISAKFTESTCGLFVRLFPHVRHLVVYMTHNKRVRSDSSQYSRNYPDYLLLARHLFPRLPKLTGLSLFGKFNHSTCHDVLDLHKTEARVEFCEAINQIDSLKRLDMCLENIFEFIHPPMEIGRWNWVLVHLPVRLEQILPRLEQLSISHHSENFGEHILRHLGPACTTLRLHRVNLPRDVTLAQLLVQNSITLTHLQVTAQFYTITSKAQCFARLESLELSHRSRKTVHHHGPPPETNISLEVILPNLAQLSKLSKLTLMGFDIALFEDEQENVPVMNQITHLSIYSDHYLVKDLTAWFRGLSRIFPIVNHLTLAFNIDYTINLNTDVSLNFQHCTLFRLLYLLCDDLTHTLVSSLSRHLRKRFYRVYQPGMSVDLWCQEDEHDAEQLWTRRNGQSEWVKWEKL